MVLPRPKLPAMVLPRPKSPAIILPRPKLPGMVLLRSKSPAMVMPRPKSPPMVLLRPKFPAMLLLRHNSPVIGLATTPASPQSTAVTKAWLTCRKCEGAPLDWREVSKRRRFCGHSYRRDKRTVSDSGSDGHNYGHYANENVIEITASTVRYKKMTFFIRGSSSVY